jgi:hypothetical protein
MQSRENKDIIGLFFKSIIKNTDYINFCLVCKLWNEVGQSLKNLMADKFRLYCYKQIARNHKLHSTNSYGSFSQLTEYYHLPNDTLHGPWVVTFTRYDNYGPMKSESLTRYVYSFGKLVNMASAEEIKNIFLKMDMVPMWNF